MKATKKPASLSNNPKVVSVKLSANIKGFQKRWNASWDEAAVFSQFKNRLLFLIDKYLSHILIDKSSLNQYAYYSGLSAPYSATGKDFLLEFSLNQEGLRSTIVYKTISDSVTPMQLAWHLQNLFLVLSAVPQSKRTSEVEFRLFSFFNEFNDLLDASPSVQIRISKTKKGVTVYPGGAKLLDDRLVNDNLTGLQDYPESLKAFEQALSIYLSGDKPKFRNLIDNLRVAIEQLLRKVLNKPKNLENLSKELDDWLEKHGTHKQVRNLYGQLLHIFTTLQNDVAKHGDVELLPDEIEYLIYLTGTFMRLIIQLRRSEA
ncbi:MAG: hypothetical protein FJZ86_00775 [Chloroflexi bacterium]|nr:hypothetical protein [Chloroflexota bacterium]